MSFVGFKNIIKLFVPIRARIAAKESRFVLRVKLENVLFGERHPYRKFNDKHKIIFVHIPKNAGTSVLMLLNDGRPIHQEHATYWDYMKADYRRYSHYEKFAIVRNPWDRLLSAYKYLQNGGNGGTDLAYCEQLNSEVKDFRQFVCEWLDYDKIFSIKVLNPQYIYIYDQNDVLQVERVIRYENLSTEFDEIVEVLGIDGSLQHVNRSERGKYADYYDDEMTRKAADFYKKDIALLSYLYEGR